MKRTLLLFAAAALLLTGCAAQVMDGPGMINSYTQISQEEARQMMKTEENCRIVDVRTQEEFDAGHIPGAICVPNESIGDTPPKELPDLNQTLLIYCRSGRRSKQAAQKLFDLGYRRVYEFGGILDWTGEIVTETVAASETAATRASGKATLEYHSFDGGGPSFTVLIEKPEIVRCEQTRAYDKPDHDELTGAGYTEICTFTALAPGQTRVTVEARSPIGGNYDAIYLATVNDALELTLTEERFMDYDDIATQLQPTPTLVLEINGVQLIAILEDSDAAQAFVALLSEVGPLSLELHDYGGFEKVGPLPEALPASDEHVPAVPGDILLYQGDQLTVLYGENSWDYTRLARIPDITGEALLDLLGEGDAVVTFWVEWSE